MSENRKPSIVFMLRFRGKNGRWRRQKIECFPASQWPKCGFFPGCTRIGDENHSNWLRSRYRLRVNGKWFDDPDGHPQAFVRYKVRDLMWRSLNQEVWNRIK